MTSPARSVNGSMPDAPERNDVAHAGHPESARTSLAQRLRAHATANWPAIYVASTDSHEDQIWFSSTIEEVFDLVCDLHVTNASP